jgi:hypothetical protein
LILAAKDEDLDFLKKKKSTMGRAMYLLQKNLRKDEFSSKKSRQEIAPQPFDRPELLPWRVFQ